MKMRRLAVVAFAMLVLGVGTPAVASAAAPGHATPNTCWIPPGICVR